MCLVALVSDPELRDHVVQSFYSAAEKCDVAVASRIWDAHPECLKTTDVDLSDARVGNICTTIAALGLALDVCQARGLNNVRLIYA